MQINRSAGASRPGAPIVRARALTTPEPKSTSLLKIAGTQGAKHQNQTRAVSRAVMATRPATIPGPDETQTYALPGGATLGVAGARGMRRYAEDALAHEVWGANSMLVLCDGHGGKDSVMPNDAAATVLRMVHSAVEALPTDAPPEQIISVIKDTFMSKVESLMQRVLGSLDPKSGIPKSETVQEAIQYIHGHVQTRLESWMKDPEVVTQALAAAESLEYLKGEPDDYKERWQLLTEKFCGPIAKEFLKAPTGCTVLAALRLQDRMYIINLGDSRALWRYHQGSTQQLTFDHNADTETRRLQKYSIPVIDRRVNGVLAPSRGLGDASMNAFIKRRPQVTCFDLPAEGGHLILGCDGVFDYLANFRVSLCLRNNISPADGAEAIRDTSYTAGSTDNVTVGVVHFPPRATSAG